MADPGPDPPISGNNTSEGGEDFDVTLGYSNETERIRAFCDLIHLAFTCDLSRAGSLMMTIAQSHLNMYPIIGEPWDLHEISHGSREPEVVGKAIAWHVDFFAYLAAKLRDTPEGDGSVLDHCAMVLVHEGGWGRNGSAPAALDVFPDITSHSTENMGCLIAGGAGGLKGGVHVRAHRQHPVRVLNTALRAVGVNEELGEVKGTIDGLLG